MSGRCKGITNLQRDCTRVSRSQLSTTVVAVDCVCLYLHKSKCEIGNSAFTVVEADMLVVFVGRQRCLYSVGNTLSVAHWRNAYH